MAAKHTVPVPTPMLPIALVCSWCEGARELTEQLIAQGFDVSHGICPDCTAKFMRAEFKAAV